MSGFDPGAVILRLEHDGGRVTAMSLATRRPQVATLLRHKPVAEAQRLLPLLFSLCGKAQGLAATLALAAARGQSAESIVDAAVAAESRREHLWRLCLDLPLLLGLEVRQDLFVAGQKALVARDEGLLREMLADPWWHRLRAGLAQLPQIEAEAPDVALLPALTAAESVAIWPRLSPALAAQPSFHGRPAETGAFARCAELAEYPLAAGLADRWLARLAELAEGCKLGAGKAASAVAVAKNTGRALVETARGLLMHEVSLEGDVVADYCIVAPTEWNFHPEGRLRQWLLGREFADEAGLRRYVALAIAALDPCVRWELHLEASQ